MVMNRDLLSYSSTPVKHHFNVHTFMKLKLDDRHVEEERYV